MRKFYEIEIGDIIVQFINKINQETGFGMKMILFANKNITN